VLSTALFDKPAFKNLICNGLVLAQDGQKMSKSKKNYPPPTDILDSFGADALAPILDPVLELCAAASGGADSEVGGGAIDHFVDGRLEGCTNVAEGRPATQSSVAWGGDASKAVDGNGLDGSWGSGSCTHTNGDGPTWWQVDLGQIQDIRAVQIVNRADCCQDVS